MEDAGNQATLLQGAQALCIPNLAFLSQNFNSAHGYSSATQEHGGERDSCLERLQIKFLTWGNFI